MEYAPAIDAILVRISLHTAVVRVVGDLGHLVHYVCDVASFGRLLIQNLPQLLLVIVIYTDGLQVLRLAEHLLLLLLMRADSSNHSVVSSESEGLVGVPGEGVRKVRKNQQVW